jgi:hypothetical protein
MMRKLGALLVMLSWSWGLLAQSLPSGLQISADAFQGRTIKHRSTMVFALPNPARALSLEVGRQTSGSRVWHQWYNFPRLGWTAWVLDFGNREALGRSYSLHPFLDFFIVRKARFRLMGRLAFGLSWIDTIHHRETNQINNAIGSHWNNHTSLGMIAEAGLTERWRLRAGVSFNHNSNAKLQVPNLGLNSRTFRLGINYQITPEAEFQRREFDFQPFWRFHARLGLALTEDKIAEGPKYPIWIGNFFVSRTFSPKNRFFFGYEYLFDRSIHEFLINHGTNEPNPNLRFERHAAFVGHEFLIGQVGMMTQVFMYLNPPFEGRNFWGLKLGPKYYFWHPLRNQQRNQRWNVFAGIYLKTHYAIATHAETAIGVSF